VTEVLHVGDYVMIQNQRGLLRLVNGRAARISTIEQSAYVQTFYWRVELVSPLFFIFKHVYVEVETSIYIGNIAPRGCVLRKLSPLEALAAAGK